MFHYLWNIYNKPIFYFKISKQYFISNISCVLYFLRGSEVSSETFRWKTFLSIFTVQVTSKEFCQGLFIKNAPVVLSFLKEVWLYNEGFFFFIQCFEHFISNPTDSTALDEKSSINYILPFHMWIVFFLLFSSLLSGLLLCFGFLLVWI